MRGGRGRWRYSYSASSIDSNSLRALRTSYATLLASWLSWTTARSECWRSFCASWSSAYSAFFNLRSTSDLPKYSFLPTLIIRASAAIGFAQRSAIIPPDLRIPIGWGYMAAPFCFNHSRYSKWDGLPISTMYGGLACISIQPSGIRYSGGSSGVCGWSGTFAVNSLAQCCCLHSASSMSL